MSTFHVFSDLPAEIRLKIWALALLAAVPEASGQPRILDMVEFGRYPRRAIETPRLVLACHEVKREWDRILRKFPLFCAALPKSRCNLDADTLRWASLDIITQDIDFHEPTLRLGFCKPHCEGRKRVKRIILQPIDMLGDILADQVLDRRRVTNSMGTAIGFRRTWDSSCGLLPLRLDLLRVPQLTDVWFEGLDPFGLQWKSNTEKPSLDVASFLVDGAALVTYPSYLFRCWAVTGKIEVALLSQAKAKRHAAGQFWEDRQKTFLAAHATDGSICRIRIIRGEEDDGDEDLMKWKEILPRATGEVRAMAWHRAVWNGIIRQLAYWLASEHEEGGGITVIPLPREEA